MWNIKYDTNELIYKTEKDSHVEKTRLWLPKEKRGRRENWELDMNRCTLLINNKNQTVQHRTLYSVSCNNL